MESIFNLTYIIVYGINFDTYIMIIIVFDDYQIYA